MTIIYNLIYNFVDNNAIVTGYISGYSSYSIPPIVFDNGNSYTVTEIGDNAFKNNESLTSIIISSTVTSIGYDAFKGCKNLLSISCDNVNFIGNDGFNGCTSLANVYIPNLSDCGLYAFAGCKSLQSINIHSLNNIAPSLFYDCVSLYSVILSPNLNTISDQSFQNCSSSLSLLFSGNRLTIQNMRVGSNVFDTGITFIFSYIESYDELIGSDIRNKYAIPTYNYIFLNTLGCFLADSKVLTDKGLVPIQLLKKGNLVQTLNDGLLPVKFVGMRSFFNKLTEERINAHLYKLDKKDFPELLEDLYITGGHPLLVDDKDLDKETKKKLLDMDNTPIITEGKYRVFACVHPKAELWNDEKEYEIFDIVLENDNPNKNYGIWVNGILTESMDEEFFLNQSKMTEINLL
jgi:hypothetical protein